MCVDTRAVRCPAEARYAGIEDRPFSTRLLCMWWLSPSNNYIDVFIWWKHRSSGRAWQRYFPSSRPLILRLESWSRYIWMFGDTQRGKDRERRYGCHMYVLTAMDSSIRERRPDWDAEVPWPQRLSAQKGRGFARLGRMPGMRLTMIGGKVQ